MIHTHTLARDLILNLTSQPGYCQGVATSTPISQLDETQAPFDLCFLYLLVDSNKPLYQIGLDLAAPNRKSE